MKKLVDFWGNMVRNYRDDIPHSNFFEIVLCNFDHDEGLALAESTYSQAELADKEALRAECLQKRDAGRPSPVGFAA